MQIIIPYARYSRSPIMTDYMRGTLGLVLIVLAVSLLNMVTWLYMTFICIGVLFIVFLWMTFYRHKMLVMMDTEKIWCTSLWTQTIMWRDLTTFRLLYFPTSRDRTKGWMQLTLKSPNIRMTLDSSLEHFEEVVHYALWAARENKVHLSDKTQHNLVAFGFDTPS